MKIGNFEFDTKNKAYIMGILNVTPDSFSDGGKWNDTDTALFRVEQMISEGADIIDVGGESTRPGYEKISDEEEISRVAPVIAAIKRRFDIPVSADTYKSAVARAAIDHGADMINDIWGLQYDANMANVIAGSGVACCLMHNKSTAEYSDFEKDVVSEISELVAAALDAGIEKDRIIIDPGIGFGKTHEMNLLVLKKLRTLCALGHPVLLGCSNKSVIGNVLDLPVGERLEGTLATTAIAVMSGCSFIRVHDVAANMRALKMAQAIKNA